MDANTRNHILIVEDDTEIAMLEQDYLDINGFTSRLVTSGTEAIPAILSGDYDLVLLDLMLPDKNGYDICRAVRNRTNIPILMVTARDESVDKIRGLGLGADDYIAKPFDPAELVARVRAHLARYQRLTGASAAHPDDEIRIRDLRILPKSWKVFRNGTEIRFPNREFELLTFLARNPDQVFSKEELFERIWGYEYIGDSATVTVHIGRIREKIEADPQNPRIIETVWGAGYRLNSSDQA